MEICRSCGSDPRLNGGALRNPAAIERRKWDISDSAYGLLSTPRLFSEPWGYELMTLWPRGLSRYLDLESSI